MAQPKLSRRLTSIDASFLYLEKKSAPMHIGSIMIVEGEIRHEDLVRDMESRLHSIPRYLQRAVPTPMNIGHPTWEFDPNFNIHNHVFVHHAPAPGGEAELVEVVGPIFSKVLDRAKPLWEVHLIQGLEGGRCAMVSLTHHSMIDGVSGNDLLAAILDIRPNEPREPHEPFDLPPIPDARTRLIDALWDNAVSGIDAWTQYSKSLVEIVRELGADKIRSGLEAMTEIIPDFALPPRRLPFNRACSGERKVVWAEFSFAEARAIRRALGVSVNDVVVTVLAGAVGRYCEQLNEDIDGRTMRLMIPVNARKESQQGQLGNQVSVLPVRVPLDKKDPIQRIRAISETTGRLKKSGVSSGFHMISNLLGGTIPPPLQAAFGALARTPQPLFNMVCTNVPGPQIPLYLVGKPVVSLLPMVPTGYQMGVGCAIFTYHQKLAMGLTADIAACADVEVLRDELKFCFEELREAAGVSKIEEVTLKPRPQRPARKRPPRRARETARETALESARETDPGAAPATSETSAKSSPRTGESVASSAEKGPGQSPPVSPTNGSQAKPGLSSETVTRRP